MRVNTQAMHHASQFCQPLLFESIDGDTFSRNQQDLKVQTFVILFQAHVTNFNNLCQVHMQSTFCVFFRDFCSFGFQVSPKFCSLKKKKTTIHTKQNSCFVNSEVKVITFLTEFCSVTTPLPRRSLTPALASPCHLVSYNAPSPPL